MEEKELIRRVRNSFKAKKSQAEILAGFQKRGYKLAYADELIRKAKRPKRIIVILLISMILFFSLTFSTYTIFSNSEKMEISNPLAGFVIAGESIVENSLVEEISEDNFMVAVVNSQNQEKTYEEIEITPEFISFLLNEIGAWKLHKNPLTLQNPVINFKIVKKSFYSEIGNEIKTFEGISNSADLLFDVNRQDLIDSIMAENPEIVFVKSIQEGRTSVDIITNEADLFAKGYLELYDTLNPQLPL